MGHSNKNELKIKVVELTSTSDIKENLEVILDQIKPDAEVVFFPENSLLIRIDNKAPFEGVDFDGPEIRKIYEYAKEQGVWVLLGSVPLKGRADKGKLKNATVLMGPDREPEIVYVKSHLFDVKLEDGSEYLESKDYEFGDGPKVLEILNWKFGLSICYDLRFSNFYWDYSVKEVDAILVPSAFTVPTGEAHWKVLLRARAIESQCYVIAPAQGGHHGGKRFSYGHSLVVDPWGRVLDEIEKEKRSFCLTLKRSEIERVRKQIPMKIHRRDFK